MQASVYRLRQRGLKLPRPQQAVSGNLLLTKSADAANRPTLKAQLLDAQGVLAMPALTGAAVRRITANGIVIIGTEIIARRHGVKASADCWPQTWWCMVPTVALAADWSGMYEDMEQKPSATGF
jgi:hypothetical protein